MQKGYLIHLSSANPSLWGGHTIESVKYSVVPTISSTYATTYLASTVSISAALTNNPLSSIKVAPPIYLSSAPNNKSTHASTPTNSSTRAVARKEVTSDRAAPKSN
jgi:hypothetical protein